jgi:spermidine dehydrogenase
LTGIIGPMVPPLIETARKGRGRVAIANSGSGACARSAIDQATRAVGELPGTAADASAHEKFPGPPFEMLEL